jgi:hypothetical protein
VASLKRTSRRQRLDLQERARRTSRVCRSLSLRRSTKQSPPAGPLDLPPRASIQPLARPPPPVLAERSGRRVTGRNCPRRSEPFGAKWAATIHPMRGRAGTTPALMSSLLLLAAFAGFGAAGPSPEEGAATAHVHVHLHDGALHEHHHRRATTSSRDPQPAALWVAPEPGGDDHCCGNHDCGGRELTASGRSRDRFPKAPDVVPADGRVWAVTVCFVRRQWRPPPRAGPPEQLLHLRTVVLLT